MNEDIKKLGNVVVSTKYLFAQDGIKDLVGGLDYEVINQELVNKSIFLEIEEEIKRQNSLGWNDQENTPYSWTSYIVNYCTRWTVPKSTSKIYTFRECMIKAAALAVQAILKTKDSNQELLRPEKV